MAATIIQTAPQPGTDPWVLNPQDADLLGRWARRDARIEYWPRTRIHEPWNRDNHNANDKMAERTEERGLNFRGYSFATKTEAVAVIIVDDSEDYASALFVVIHELAHLHAPPVQGPESLEQSLDEELRADAVAAKLMPVFGYEEGVYEPQYWIRGLGRDPGLMDEYRALYKNPRPCCCPLRR